ncbi:MAG: hypothetical protein ACU88J_10700 [Gammaproteobacteria bacterium]
MTEFSSVFFSTPFLAQSKNVPEDAYRDAFVTAAAQVPPDTVSEGSDQLYLGMHLEVAAPEARAVLLPADQHEKLIDKERRALDYINRGFFLPADETILRSYISFLTSPASVTVEDRNSDLAVGTAVYVRETQAATIWYVMPGLKIDIQRGQPVLVEALTSQTPVMRPDFALKKAVSPKKALKTAFTLIKTFKFLIPKPYGDFTGAGIAIIEMLMGGDDSTSISDAVAEIKDFMQQKDAEKQMRHISAFTDWLQLKSASLGDTPIEDSVDYILDDLLKYINDTLDSTATDSLFSNVNALAEDALVRQKDGLDRLCLAVAVYLLALKIRTQLESIVATHPVKGREVEQRSAAHRLPEHYRTFMISIKGDKASGIVGWAERIESQILIFRNERMAKIGQVSRGRQYNPMKGLAGGHDDGWGFNDEAYPNPLMVSWMFFFADRQNNCFSVTERKEEATKAHTAYVDKISKEVEVAHAEYKKFASDLKNNIISWPEKLPQIPLPTGK